MFNWIKSILTDVTGVDPAATAGTQPRAVGAQSEAYRKQGNLFLADGNLYEAEASYRQSIAADPNSVNARINLGFVLLKQNRLEDAKLALERAVSVDPQIADGHYLLATLSQQRNRQAEAIGNFDRALAINPEFAEAHHGLGVTFRVLGRLDEALRCFDKALSIRPGFSPSRFNKSLVLLLRGDFAGGLELFESRLDVCEERQILDWMAYLSDHPEKPLWQGQDLQGRRLLVWTEQGAGDCMMMMRYVPRLAEKSVGKILVLSDPSLTRLIQTLPVACEVTSQVGDRLWESFDFHCSIMSLPFLFGTRLDTIPNVVPYLHVADDLRKKWSERLAGSKGLRVGLVWAGNRGYGRDFVRSVSLRQLSPLFDVPGATFISLQKGVVADELEDTHRSMLNWMDECEDFMDTAALIANLSLVISVDTSVAHLTGALGVPVWLLNRFESEWRWLRDGDRSPWYPTMRIFRQTVSNDWDSVVKRIADEL